jgi:hypothetical protein
LYSNINEWGDERRKSFAATSAGLNAIHNVNSCKGYSNILKFALPWNFHQQKRNIYFAFPLSI